MASQSHNINIIVTGKDKASGPLGAVKGALGGVASVAGGMLAAGVISRVAGGLADLGKNAILGAGDTVEMLSKMEVSFDEWSVQVTENLTAFANEVGRSRFSLMTMATDMGAVFKGMGFGADAAAELSEEMTKLAVDVGSFNNLPSEDVAQRFTRALTGEFESLKALGIVINQNRIDQHLANQGIEESWQSLDQYTRANMIAALITESASDAMGDAARTSDSFANQMVALKAQFADTTTEIGLKLLPVLTPLLTQFGDMASVYLPALVEMFANQVVPAIQSVAQWIGGSLIPTIEGIGGKFGEVRGAVGGVLDWIGANIMPKLQPVIDAFQTILPPVIQAAGDLWTTTLQPAIAGVMSFLETSVMPLLLAVVGLIGEGLAVAVEQAGKFFSEKLVPGIKAFAEWLGPKLQGPMDKVREAVQWLIDKINALKDALSGLRLPKDFEPGSPTPFEIGLRGIGGAMSNLRRSEIPQLARELNTLEGGTIDQSQNTTNIMPIGQQVINNQADADAVMANFLQAARRS